ncbi:FtsK/SpoIIIE domain-containing protein [uncultured Campylobacter sp.]|uniref:FtsK/SpoIIIE domain-containing protein n=1 Tax=uncultured Campylobacter sp. TaxID=218934 RepID=UPI003211B6CF
MLGKIYTKTGEENFINSIINNSLCIANLPKYFILRLALNKCFKLEYRSLDHECYSNLIPYDGVGKNEGEYNMAQVTGDGKGNSKNYTDLLRATLSLRHRDENLDFSDDSIFTGAISKYIHRGLLEIYNLYKSKDDFYQFLLDEFKEQNTQAISSNEITGTQIDSNNFEEYLKSENFKGKIVSYDDALRHDVFKIHFEDMKSYERLKKEADEYKVKFGLYSDAFTEYAGEPMSLNLYFPKPKELWKKFGLDEFVVDINSYSAKHKLALYCGRDIKNQPFFFDLEQHLLVAGTSGSGKSVLLHTLITSLALLNKNVKFVLIDPKNGAEFGVYDGVENLSELVGKSVVKDIVQVQNSIDTVVEEMNNRYVILAENGVNKNSELEKPLDNIVVVMDEVADAFGQIKTLQDGIVALAQKARAAGIHLIIATQTPNAEILKQALRANFDMRIALKVQNSKASQIVIDQSGAEKLLGSGDMLVKINGEIMHIFSPLLNPEDIKQILKI